ncbi:MAG: NAD-dependent epimerase/dehydratase family protein [Verrucomicrobiota bacterium]
MLKTEMLKAARAKAEMLKAEMLKAARAKAEMLKTEMLKAEGRRALTEEDCIEPDTAYGKSKLAAEELVLHGGYVPEPVVLRLCMVYGPQAKGDREGRGEMGDGRLKMEET